MGSFGKALAMFLAVLWLPVTAHCELERMGLFPGDQAGAEACCPDTADHCARDGCALVERPAYFPAGQTVKTASPRLLADALLPAVFLVFSRSGCERSVAYERCDAPRDWVAQWYFERRAASPPRAPSLNA